MSKRDLIARELGRLSEQDIEDHAEAADSTMAAETALAKDWLSPEEDAAWASL
jgi:hypothetical protein